MTGVVDARPAAMQPAARPSLAAVPPGSVPPGSVPPGSVPPGSVAPGSIVKLDIPFVTPAGPKQTLDLYIPAQARQAPVVVYVHAGEWAKRDKNEVGYKPLLLNQHGIILASVNYRLSDTAQHPAQVNDVAAAVRWLRDHIAAYGGDPRKIILLGHSAGCHLVTLVGLDPRPLAGVGLQPGDLAGVISWSGGAFDLVAKANAGGMYAKYIRLNFGDKPEVWRDASPIAHVGDAKPMPRFLFVSAGAGYAGAREISEEMATRIQAAGGNATCVVLPGKTHATADHDLGMPGDDSSRVLLDFLHAVGAGK